MLYLQQFYYCNLEALSFAPFIFASTFGMSPFQEVKPCKFAMLVRELTMPIWIVQQLIECKIYVVRS